MTVFTETITESFHVVSCYTCGVRFGIGSKLYRRTVTDAKGSIYCPACGSCTCWKESEDALRIKQLEQKLQWEMENSQRLRQERESVEKSLIANKAVVTRLQRRIGSGVCPCCHRTFKQLAAHMANKHPKLITLAGATEGLEEKR